MLSGIAIIAEIYLKSDTLINCVTEILNSIKGAKTRTVGQIISDGYTQTVDFVKACKKIAKQMKSDLNILMN
jgi:hypothetical protein